MLFDETPGSSGLPIDFNSQLLEAWTRDCEGSLKEALSYFYHTGGKRFRPLLCFELGRALELPRSQVLDLSLTVETLHAASLIHDDLQDEDTHRRGLLTVWKRFNVATAISAGDYLLVLSQTLFPDFDIQTLVQRASLDLAKGQQLEQDLNRHLGAPADRLGIYNRVAKLKTGALFRLIFEGCGRLRLGDEAVSKHRSQLISQLPSFSRLGENLGVFFQAVDDFIDIFGNKGREVRGRDLVEGKFGFLQAMCARNTDLPMARSLLESGLEPLDKLQILDQLLQNSSFRRSVLDTVESMKRDIYNQSLETSPAVVSVVKRAVFQLEKQIEKSLANDRWKEGVTEYGI